MTTQHYLIDAADTRPVEWGSKDVIGGTLY